ncbi:ankyrin repeat-containing domain protein [Triangularia verruculosa]|uniref:Ankyrin repeat-containing domain protein n=1 Tax=Triangularia verruculosa TaxID=2587418 RepID=A0AAN6XCJ0_9PEZI|nr:ankyrin repeat-containing domain protein [Triangularia verruculosa]
MALPIHLAILSGNIELVRYITATVTPVPQATISRELSRRFCPCILVHLEGQPEDQNVGDATWTELDALHMAACNGHQDIVEHLLLLDNRFPRGTTCYIERTSAERPALRGAMTFVKHGCLPVHLAVRSGHLGMLDALIIDAKRQNPRNRLVDVLDNRLLPLIWHAYLTNQWAVVDQLLRAGADIDDDLSEGYTPMIHAIIFGRWTAVKELIKRGANVNITTITRPMDRIFSMRLGISRVDYRSYYGLRPIDICLITPNPTQELKSVQFRVTKRRSKEGGTVWQPSGRHIWRKEVEFRDAERQREEAVKALVEAGASLKGSAVSVYKTPPLVAAAAEHLPTIVEYLIRKGAPVNDADVDGATALVAALGYGHYGCPFHDGRQLKYGHDTPICRGLQQCIKLLLQNGADVKPSRGDAALLRLVKPTQFRYTAAKRDTPRLGTHRDWELAPNDKHALARLLLQHNGDANDRSITMPTPPIDVFRASRPNLTDPNGFSTRAAATWPWSPLQHAFWERDFPLCWVLVKHGAVPPSDDILWMYQLMVSTVMMTSNFHWCSFRSADWFDLLAQLPTQAQFDAMSSPVALAWTLSLLRESVLRPEEWDRVLERRLPPSSCCCFSGSGAPVRFGKACHGLKYEDFSQLAWDIWSLSINPEKFQEKVDARRWHPRYGNKPIMLATVCVEEAVCARESRILQGLLNMKIEDMVRAETLQIAVALLRPDDPISCYILELLMHQVLSPRMWAEMSGKGTSAVLASPNSLLRHGKCLEFMMVKKTWSLAGWKEYPGCQIPLQYAICVRNRAAVRLISHFHSTNSGLNRAMGAFCIREACIRLDTEALAILLGNSTFVLACNGGHDSAPMSPLIFLLQNIRNICNGGSHLNQNFEGVANFDARLRQIPLWVVCLSKFRGVD